MNWDNNGGNLYF
jgi:hypothetical protein